MNMCVSNLGFRTSEDDLRKLFEPLGQISSVRVINDHETGRSRGFGFVQMTSDAEATQAMKKLNGKEVDGRSISVTIARQKENQPNKKRW